MRVLAIDTSFEACSAALVDGASVLWTEQRIIGRGHAEALPVMVAGGLSATGLAVNDLDRVGVVIGPGAFAGVRVGLAFARALCLGTKVEAVGVTSPAALGASIKSVAPNIAPVFDARRGQVYAALYDATRREHLAPFVAAPVEAAQRLASRAQGEKILLVGSGAPLVAPHVETPCAVDPTTLIDPVAVALLAAASAPGARPPAPLYLRPPDASPSKGSIFPREVAV